MNLNIIKVDRNNYIIQDNAKPAIITIPEIVSPFGLEIYNNVNYINFQIDEDREFHKKLLQDLNIIENYFSDYVKNINKNIEFQSSIKIFDKYKPLWKVRINHKGRSMIKCSKNDIDISWTDYDYKGVHDILIVLHSLWIKNNKAGLIWCLDSIKCV